MRATLPPLTDMSLSPSAADSLPDTPFAPVASRIPSRAARAHRILARVLLGGVALQIFFAGLGVFGVSSFLPHAILGTLVIGTSFALPVVAWRGHLGASLVRRSVALTGLMALQGLLIDLGHVVPVLSAFHPVNAMLIVLVTYGLATRKL